MRSRKWTAVYSAISDSVRVADCGTDGALFYTWLLLHVDSWGRADADPRKLNSKVWPCAGKSPKDVTRILGALERERLIVLYESRGRPALSIPDWDQKAGSYADMQRKRGESEFEDPPLHSPQDRTPQNKTVQGQPQGSPTRALGLPFDWEEHLSGLYGGSAPEVATAWRSWLAYRRESKFKAPAPSTVRATFKKYLAEPERLIAAIEHTIEKGWQGLREEEAPRGPAIPGPGTAAQAALDIVTRVERARPSPGVQDEGWYDRVKRAEEAIGPKGCAAWKAAGRRPTEQGYPIRDWEKRFRTAYTDAERKPE